MAIKHTFNSAIADDAVPGGKVQPSHWNADHDLSAMVLGDVPGLTDALDAKQDLGTMNQTPLNAAGTTTPYLSSPLQSYGSAGLVAHGLNTWRAARIVVPFKMNVVPSMQVNTAVATSVVSAGLYKTGGTGLRPHDLVQDLGTFAVSVTGRIETAAITLNPGEYWLVWNVTGATTGNVLTVTAATTEPWVWVDTTNSTRYARWDSASTAVSPVPANLSAVAWSSSTSAVACPIFFRIT